MSSSTAIFNGEKLPSDMDPNMVSITKPTRERSRRIEAHSVGDKCFEKSALNFDHLYASTVKNSGENFKFSEVKQIKELLVLHLDLIQQQSEEIQSKDKLIAALREENELLKLRLQHSEGRMALKRNRDSPQRESRIESRYLPKRNDICDPDAKAKMGGNGTSVLSKKNVLLLESDTNCMVNSSVIAPDRKELHSNKLPLSEINVASADMESFELMNISESSTSSGYLNGVSHSKLSSSKKIGRLKRGSRESIVSAGSARSSSKRTVPLNHETSSKNENHLSSPLENGPLNLRMRIKKSDDECSCDETMDSSDLMTTDVPYYTMTGCAPPDILNEKDITTDKLEIPSWRHKVFTSCYSMEGTENLSDDVFEKRHARLEQEEKRRKRWDVQRIREQRQLDHLRENERKRNWLAKSDDEGEKERQRVCSLYPNVSGTTRISIDESLPVNALGVVLKRVEPREFSLPWKDGNTSCGFSYDKDTFTIKTRRK